MGRALLGPDPRRSETLLEEPDETPESHAGSNPAPHPDASRVPDPALPPGLRRRVRGPRPVRVGPSGQRLLRGQRELVVVLAVLAVLVAVAGAGLGWHAWQSSLAVQRNGTGVPFGLEVPGFGEGSSPIPLRVEGTTEGGAAVSGVRLVSQTSGWLSLAPGSYEVSVAGSPVTAEGGVFSVPTGVWRVSVSAVSGQVTAPDGTVSASLSIAFEPKDPDDVTQKDVEDIRAWMLDLGVQGVDGYASAIEAAGAA